MEKKEKKHYQSKNDYGKKWNKSNINVSISRDLVTKLKSKIGMVSLKSYLESLIQRDLDI